MNMSQIAGRAPQAVLQVGAPGAQQHQLRALAHEPLKVVADQVHALLLVQAPDEAQQRRVRVLRQAQLLRMRVPWRATWQEPYPKPFLVKTLQTPKTPQLQLPYRHAALIPL